MAEASRASRREADSSVLSSRAAFRDAHAAPMWFNFSTRNIDECLEGGRARHFSKNLFFRRTFRSSIFIVVRFTRRENLRCYGLRDFATCVDRDVSRSYAL